MTPEEGLNEIMKDAEQIIGEEAHSFYTRLKQASPVDTGHFKISWRAPVRLSKYKWRIRNVASYASILSTGRYHALGRWYGSLQWAGGLTPMIMFTNNQIQRRLDAIKH